MAPANSEIREQQLERLFLNNAELEQIVEALDVFCPFEAIGMERQEIRHGHFLAYVLDPQRPHGFGAECLRSFMWAAATALSEKEGSVVRPLDVHLMNLDSAIVQREYRSIDLLIQIPATKIVVAVELKIDATEHSGQLGRYRSIVETDFPQDDGWQQVLLFLTKRGDRPSKVDGKHWHTLPLDAAANAFDAVIKKGSGVTDARVLLNSYVNMLRRKHLTDARLEELARKLWKEHADALEFLMARRPNLASEVFGYLLTHQEKVAQTLSESTGVEIVKDHSSKTYLRFAVSEWDAIPGMLSGTGWKPSKRMMVFEVWRASNGEIKCYFVLGPGDSQQREQLFNALKAANADIGGNWDLAPKWRQMGAATLAKIDDEQAVEEQITVITEGMVKFLIEKLPSFGLAAKKLIEGRNTG